MEKGEGERGGGEGRGGGKEGREETYVFINTCFRYGMSSVSMNDEMYVFGGYDNDGGPCNDCYKFNIGMIGQGEEMEGKGERGGEVREGGRGRRGRSEGRRR